jgi:transcription initiation factor TFIID TATA-box-binding protein
MPELVNAVGGGDLNEQIDLHALYNEFEGEIVRYDPEQWPGLYIQFTTTSVPILLFRTGKYNIAGADSIGELKSTNENMLSYLQNIDIGKNASEFEVRNLVFLDTYQRELELDQLAIGLGLERAEYEPEQFPGIVYDRSDITGTFLIFSTGKVILTGVKDPENSISGLNRLFDELDTLFD